MAPNVPDIATSAPARLAGYPALRICPTANFATVAAVAILEPETAAKPALATTAEIPNPPGSLRKTRRAIKKTWSPIFAFSANIPIRINIGMIVSVNVDVCVKETEAREFETKSGPCNINRPTIPDPARASHTGIRHANSPSSRKITKSTVAVVVIVRPLASAPLSAEVVQGRQYWLQKRGSVGQPL